MDKQTYRLYADYGEKGINAESIDFSFRPNETYSLPETLDQKIGEVWARLTSKNPRLHDGTLLNLLKIEENSSSIRAGVVSFRDYVSLWYALVNNTTTDNFELSSYERIFIKQNIKPLSSYMAVTTGDQIVVGTRNTSEGKWLSFPGSGYLDTKGDTTDDDRLHPTARILQRELYEELNIEKVENIVSLGISAEEIEGIYLNPAIFSLSTVDYSSEYILEEAQEAQDHWEFEEIFTVPLNEEILRNIVQKEPPEWKSILPQSVPRERLSLAPKTPLMIAFIGRYQFGKEWYDDIVTGSRIQIEY